VRSPHPRRSVVALWHRLVRRRQAPEPLELVDAALHAEVQVEAICPDCLTWIRPGDYVRRNAFGLLEHEVCPPEHVHDDSRR
jgi:hypothetical protein